MDIDTSRTLTKCEKCNHGRWSDDATPCKGCYPPAVSIRSVYRSVNPGLTDAQIDAIREKNIALKRIDRNAVKILTPIADADAEFQQWLRDYFYPYQEERRKLLTHSVSI